MILAANAVTYIAKGLQLNFAPYKNQVSSNLLQRCKEKKQNVVDALNEALDACFMSVGVFLAC